MIVVLMYFELDSFLKMFIIKSVGLHDVHQSQCLMMTSFTQPNVSCPLPVNRWILLSLSFDFHFLFDQNIKFYIDISFISYCPLFSLVSSLPAMFMKFLKSLLNLHEKKKKKKRITEIKTSILGLVKKESS